MSVIEGSAPPTEDPDLPDQAVRVEDAAAPVEDLDGRPIESDEPDELADDGPPIESDQSADDGPARSAGTGTVPALGKHPDDPPGATRRMITAIAVVVLILAAVAALTVDGVSEQHRRPAASLHKTPTTSVHHRVTTSKRGA